MAINKNPDSSEDRNRVIADRLAKNDITGATIELYLAAHPDATRRQASEEVDKLRGFIGKGAGHLGGQVRLIETDDSGERTSTVVSPAAMSQPEEVDLETPVVIDLREPAEVESPSSDMFD